MTFESAGRLSRQIVKVFLVGLGLLFVGGVSIAGPRDKTPPKIVITTTTVDGSKISASGWYRASVRVQFTCSDSGSGVASCPAMQTVTTEGANQLISGVAKDKAGNTATAKITLNIDLTKPLIAVNLSPAALAGYYTTAVTAHFTCTDGLSGIAACPADQVISNDGQYTLSGAATDKAGNSASSSTTFTIEHTPPALTISSPANGAQIPDDLVTITGKSTDSISGIASVQAGSATAVPGADGTFTLGPLALMPGANTFTIVSTNRAGLSATQALTVSRSVTPTGVANLVQDPQFELGVSGFAAQDSRDSVTQSGEAPIEGTHSLRTLITRWGNNVWWSKDFSGGLASRLTVSAHLRSDVQSASTLNFCAMVYYGDGTTDLNCTPVASALGDKGVVTAQLDIDSVRRLASVHIRLTPIGDGQVAFTLDEAVVNLVVIEAPPTSGGGSGGGSSGGSGGGAVTCAVSSPSAYPGFAYHLPTARPFISLSHYAATDRNSTAYTRFKAAADAALAGSPPYAYSATHSVTMYLLSGNTSYIDDAIGRVEAFVSQAEAAIAAGGRPAVADDSYLGVGEYLEQLSLTYDYGYARLTASQRLRWASFAEQTLQNLWNPATTSWGSVAYSWSGWSLCDPGNNYHFSFLRATMLWALASQNTAWLDFLQTQKFGPLTDYYAQLPGGGSREGTGYGTAQRNLFLNDLYWVDSTGENLAGLTAHTRETIDYWVHATVPTRDRFAPIGDQARVSIPNLYDYQENLVHTAVVLSQGTSEARHGTWWLQNNSVNGVSHSFNLWGDLLPYPDTPVAPTDLVYHARGVGELFARSSWDTDAAWVAIVAGKYDQSHAHQDQGSFTFFRGDWLAVTQNIWSHSGIHQEVDVHNVIRFERADGSVIPQSMSDTVQSSMTATNSNGGVTVAADLTNAYWRNQDAVRNWTRNFEFAGNTLRVTDTCNVAAGVTPVFQLQVPVAPVQQADGSILAGNLKIIPLQGVTVTWTPMAAPEFSQGYRIDFRSTSGCSFDFEFRAQ